MVMGGPHVTFDADEALEFATTWCAARARRPSSSCSRSLEGSGSPADVLGLSYHEADGVHRHTAAPPAAPVPGRPAHARPGVDRPARPISPTPFITSRGCPFDCEFCSVILMFGRRVRTDRRRPGHRRHPGGSGRTSIFFYDDNFILSKRRDEAPCSPAMIREDLIVPFSAQIRVDSVCKDGRVDHELLQLLREAGCFFVYLGLESVNPLTLAAFNKHQSVADIAGGLAALADYGIELPRHVRVRLGHRHARVAARDDRLRHRPRVSTVAVPDAHPAAGDAPDGYARGARAASSRGTGACTTAITWSSGPSDMSPLDLQQAAIEAHQRFYRRARVGAYQPALPDLGLPHQPRVGARARATWPTCGSCAPSPRPNALPVRPSRCKKPRRPSADARR